MALVAYDYSDSENSDEDEEVTGSTAVLIPPIPKTNATTIENTPPIVNGSSSKILQLPAPKISTIEPDVNHISDDDDDDDDDASNNIADVLTTQLPEPKANKINVIVEEDDEFLKKKAQPEVKPPPPPVREKVKITIPSLSQFKDLDEEDDVKKTLGPSVNLPAKRISGLLSMLPKPQNDIGFCSVKADSSKSSSSTTTRSFVPNSVTQKGKAPKATEKKAQKPSTSKSGLVGNYSDSEDDGSDHEDFFSFNSKSDLPEVNKTIIEQMVNAKAAKMKETKHKLETPVEATTELEPVASTSYRPHYEKTELDEEAIRALAGSTAKRARREEMNIIDVSTEEIIPSKEEWMRTAIQSATTYIPRGLNTKEEPAAGTRRKHQITYLAHQAKINEMELQAMWAENRHARRQTQSKYGF